MFYRFYISKDRGQKNSLCSQLCIPFSYSRPLYNLIIFYYGIISNIKTIEPVFSFFVSLEGAGITGSVSDSSIRTHYVTSHMGLAFMLFNWWPWCTGRHVISNGPFWWWIFVGTIQRWGMLVPVWGRVKERKAPIVIGYGWVFLHSSQQMVLWWAIYLDVPKIASSWTVPCQVYWKQGSSVESSVFVYLVQRILPYYAYVGVHGKTPMAPKPPNEMVWYIWQWDGVVRRVGAACIPNKVGSSKRFPWQGASVDIEEQQKASPCYLRAG